MLGEVKECAAGKAKWLGMGETKKMMAKTQSTILKPPLHSILTKQIYPTPYKSSKLAEKTEEDRWEGKGRCHETEQLGENEKLTNKRELK